MSGGIASAMQGPAGAYFAFLGRFLTVLAAGEIFYHGILRPNPAFESYLEALAKSSAVVLRVLGEQVVAHGNMVAGNSFAFSIVTDCDAVDAIIVFIAGVLAIPGGRALRLLGAACGSAALAAVNLVRIVSLYFIGVHWPGSFDLFHEGIWQPAMILLSFGLWFVFVRISFRRRT
ncbi:MAG: hypothetical protein AB7V45_00455 [Candidatus Krumholzibacteriia bacterium]